MKKSILVLMIFTMLCFSGCDNNSLDNIVYNKSINECTLISQKTKSQGKSTLCYITIQKGNETKELQINFDVYNALQDITKSSLILNNSEKIKLNVIYNEKDKKVMAVSIER